MITHRCYHLMGLLQLWFDYDPTSIRLRRCDQNCDSTAIRLDSQIESNTVKSQFWSLPS